MRKSWKMATAATILTVMLSLSSGADVRAYSDIQTATPQTDEQSISLKAQVRLWADQLSNAPDASFRKWKGAWISTAPLGPGTHSWLALLKKNQTVVGYMIVHAKENGGGFVLGEYGIGEYPPFSTQSLKLAQNKLELSPSSSMKVSRIYVNPLQAAWQLSIGTSAALTDIHYIDAYSGEELPVDNESWSRLSQLADNAAKHGLTGAHASITSSAAMESFDPYGRMPWLTKSPYKITDHPFQFISQAISSKEQLRYVCETFDGRMLYAWSVTGYTKWSNGELFIALDNEEDAAVRRYVPVSLLLSYGQFYR